MVDLKFPPEVERSPLGLTRSQAAKALGVSEEALRRWEAEGAGPTVVRLSERRAVYPVAELTAFINSRTKPARDDAAR
ncbi:hypothetical protein CCR97_09120 [Rhodoplanes elegans]|uniref:HTH cro/C1-type domain-containing protein n=1 Tax=Rhodoplanes elegans TaxID=29408 RepID=A0A327KWI6_9BRAD|nr:helix-turn-helix domain-containing protein [Rhodoplanes elegans]MBK5958370.1 hypothetical protein [Rhodoplanes elegans]RAI39738.1 hypothetical protein CH338_08420 [Rhodoplanes elegans]